MARALCLPAVILFLLCPLCLGISYAGPPSCSGPEGLADKFRTIANKLEKSSLGIPVYLESSAGSSTSDADMYGIVSYPFDIVRNELSVPANWCDIVLPHINVRACTYEKLNDEWLLTIYSVNKFYQPLKDAYQMKFDFRTVAEKPEYFDISLDAHEGPFSTRDHRFGFEAIPVDNDRTFVHLSYSYSYSFLGCIAMKSYLAVFGRGKVGFSITGVKEGNPLYVSGLRGAIERNVVRYYLAMLAYLDTLKFAPEQRFRKRINQWYELTGRYGKQLSEMGKDKYLAYKKEDQKNQLRLQRGLSKENQKFF
jgi:hypothetical protein